MSDDINLVHMGEMAAMSAALHAAVSAIPDDALRERATRAAINAVEASIVRHQNDAQCPDAFLHGLIDGLSEIRSLLKAPE